MNIKVAAFTVSEKSINTFNLWSCSGGALEYTLSQSGISENKFTNELWHVISNNVVFWQV